MEDFESELRQAFLDEASQLLQEAEQTFLALERNPQDGSLIESLFRLAHNLKGSSRAVGFDKIGEFTHELESLLLNVKQGKTLIDATAMSLLLECSDHLAQWVNSLKEDPKAQRDSTELLGRIRAQIAGTAAVAPTPSESPTSPESHEATPATPETEIAVAHPEAEENARAAPAAGDQSIRVSFARLEKLLNIVGEMVLLQTVLRDQAYQADPTLFRKTVHQLGKVTREIRDLSMGLRMVPLKPVFLKMQRIVRDTSTSLKKEVHFEIVGEDTEVDKTILENLSDPLIHLVRNAVDHGIETPENRVAKGKPAHGTIKLSAFHRAGNLYIEARDDGGGVDPARVRQKAVEKGIIDKDAVLKERDVLGLIFEPGFSTKTEVTDISGRGVGLDVVKNNIERIMGEVELESKVGEGCTFRIRLPLTLAITDAMIVNASKERFVIPLGHVYESIKPKPDDIHRMSNAQDFLLLRGENIPIYKLTALLARPSDARPCSDYIALVVRMTGNPFAVLVDEIVSQQQVVIKKLGAETRNLKGFTGTTILGDGKPALILELPELVGSPVKQKANQEVPPRAKEAGV